MSTRARLFAELLAHRDNSFWVSSVLGRRRTFPQFRLPAAGLARARWICHFASRYSTRNGRAIGPSPGLPRGGGIAEKCDGVRGQTKPRSYYRDGPGARRTALRGSTCARRESDPGCDPGLYAPQRPAIPIAALNLKAEATARFPDGCQLVDFELLRL